MFKQRFLIGDPVFIVGHKVPDLDAIVSAYAYELYRHSKGDFNYVAIRCGKPNPITTFTFDYWKVNLPPFVKKISKNTKLVLVDHTEPDQRIDGWENGEIIEVVDHHRLSLETNSPAKVTVRPYGSTSTIIARKFLENGLFISKSLAGLLFSAIVDDTVAFRSPITTRFDRLFAGKMATIAEIEDIEGFARSLMAAKDVWADMEVEKLVFTDIKEFNFGAYLVYISQIETTRGDYIDQNRAHEIKTYLENINKQAPANLRLVMITDILTSMCVLIAVGDNDKVQDLAEAFDAELVDGYKLYLPGVVSRKKQVVPVLAEYFDTADS